ncbi:MAG: hypothetical protein E7319_02520 [Clostridiales bacterium]|nr:hypothetical protein [Clostridiales bacterium]
MSELIVGNAGLASYLAGNIGRELIAEFQCGNDEVVRKAGTLTAVENDFFVLRDDMNLRDVVCVLNHLCFITFYLSGTLPQAEERQPSASLGEVRSVSSTQPVQSSALAALNYAKRKGRKLD